MHKLSTHMKWRAHVPPFWSCDLHKGGYGGECGLGQQTVPYTGRHLKSGVTVFLRSLSILRACSTLVSWGSLRQATQTSTSPIFVQLSPARMTGAIRPSGSNTEMTVDRILLLDRGLSFTSILNCLIWRTSGLHEHVLWQGLHHWEENLLGPLVNPL